MSVRLLRCHETLYTVNINCFNHIMNARNNTDNLNNN
jgi:hypothetical protein